MIEPKTAQPSFLNLRGVGKKIAAAFAKLDVYTIEDLLLHLPYRYQDKTTIIPIARLRVGLESLCEGTIVDVSFPSRGRTKLLCLLRDQTGLLYVRFFHVMAFQKNTLVPDAKLRCFGEVRLSRMGFEMSHPEVQVITCEETPLATHLTPVYPATQGLKQAVMRKITGMALSHMTEQRLFTELLPDSLLQSKGFPAIDAAIQFIHQPPAETSTQLLSETKTLAQRRIIFEELLAHRLSLLHMKKVFQTHRGFALQTEGTRAQDFLNHLPFQLTNAQQKAIREIKEDLMQEKPMLRLLQGDVGSGKTVIAAFAVLQAIENGFQAAIMAPTEILAEQHYQTFQKWFAAFNIQVALLSGSNSATLRRKHEHDIATGSVQLVVGTHALFQANVQFIKLALIVIDEQHRFGVTQRALLRQKGEQETHCPHQLYMTATPIPRTLALSFYADLDTSIVNELPPGRMEVVTSVIPNHKRLTVVERIKEVCLSGRQVYWVCPLIEVSETLGCQAAAVVAEELQALLPTLSIGLVHGKLTAKEKDATMKLFQQGETKLLVATTVIEVGVDVPNASVIVIENAERLGLSQLHQLRGRVGRGAVASHCILLYQAPLSTIAQERLSVMRHTTDGFQIAEKDLALRGPGEVLGTRQTGSLSFRVADLLRDTDLLPGVQEAADLIMKNSPDVIAPLLARWFNNPVSDVML